SVSLTDQRAKGRGIDGLAAVDAGLDDEEQGAGFVELGFALLDGLQLRLDDGAKVHVAVRSQLADLREAEAGALQREDLLDALKLAAAVQPPTAVRAQW